MEILSASSAITAVSFLSWPQKRASSKMVSTMCNLKMRSIKRRTLNKVRVEKLSWVGLVGSGSVCTLMASLIWGLTEKAAIALEPRGSFDIEGPVNEVGLFLDKYPFVPFVVSFVIFFVVPLASDQYEKSIKWTTAEEAYSKLRDEKESQLVDIRTQEEIDATGSPEISSFNKEVLKVTYVGEGDDVEFLSEMLNRFKEPYITELYILDMYGGKSMQVAQMLTRNGFKAAYAIRDGFQGSNGWQAFEEKLFTDGTQYGATGSPNPKINASASSMVKQESLKDQSTESKTIPSSVDPEVRTNLVPQSAPVMPDKKVDVPTAVPSSFEGDAGVNSTSQATPVEVSSEATSLPSALSPYPQYPSLKPPTSPTPSKPSSKTMDSEVGTNLAPQPAPVMTDKKVDASTPVPSSLDRDDVVNSAFQAAPLDVSSQAPSLPRALSPYPQYPDLKPPTSPTPSKPISKIVDAATDNGAAMADEKLVVCVSETPFFSQALSPYARYPDLKPPTSPTPSKPTGKALDSTANNGPLISDPIVDGSHQITKSAMLSSSEKPLIESAIGTPCFSQPLSPYAQYPDLKPPTSPTPLKPSLAKAEIESASTIKPASVSASLNRESGWSATIEPSFEASCQYNTSSPYSMYPDLKPPTSPTPSRP